MWTRFSDMHSGGGCKEGNYNKIYIEAPQEEAEVIFYNRLGHNPNRVSCTCCGEDYSISEKESLEQLTGYDRNCHYISLKKYDPENKTWDDRYVEANISTRDIKFQTDLNIGLNIKL